MSRPVRVILLSLLILVAAPATVVAKPSFPSVASIRAQTLKDPNHLIVHGFTLHPHGTPKVKASGTFYNNAWSGYAQNPNTNYPPYPTANPIGVITDFTVPTVNCAQTNQGINGNEAMFWAGLDGRNNNQIEQGGVAELCAQDFSTQYWAWYEFYPANPVYFGDVHPGDHIHVQVTDWPQPFPNPYAYHIYVQDITTGSYFSATQNQSGNIPSSAEVVTEAPGGGPSQGWNLTAFSGGPNYNNAQFQQDNNFQNTIQGTWNYFNGDNPGMWSIENWIQTTDGTSGGTPLSQPSAINPAGTFSTPFQYSGAGTPMIAPTLTAPSTATRGSAVNVSWSNVSGATSGDWISLNSTSGADTDVIDWLYDASCTQTAGSTAKASGTCSFTLPSSLAPGTYNFRLFTNDTWTKIAQSGTLTVSSVATVSAPSTATSGSNVNVNWSGVSGPTPGDWISLNPASGADTNVVDWKYDSSCTQTVGSTGKASGTCSFALASSLAPGTYNFRLFTNDTWTKIGQSGTMTVRRPR